MASGDVFSTGQEGHSIVRPLLFNGEDYAYWKTRMRLFVQANDYQVWRIIMNGPLIPTKKIDDSEVPKEEWEWDEKDTKMAQLNAKAMHTLFCALGPDEYKRVSLCDNAKEMWDKLAITHEGTNQAKESKKKKASVTTWSDIDSSDDNDSKEDQIADLCFMACDEPEVTSNSSNLNSYTFDELQDAFDDLVIEFEEMNSKYKKMISKLKVEKELLLKSKLVLENENKDLENDFNESKLRIDILEKVNFDLKRKIDSLEQEKKIIFDKSLQVYMTKCSYCKFHGHTQHTCPIKKRTHFKVRQVWVPKGTRSFETNTQGPKAIWVPKTK